MGAAASWVEAVAPPNIFPA
ncbi:uncharacterized protein G2W53_010433 [Senna tora]|uniref:Uncharacterized protein n=1 Tax=Senna tora TaxID=362788 RepID=A0A835C9P4_9FABA|nr:uncharacterized protein G2W53_010433 [Senna tora]